MKVNYLRNGGPATRRGMTLIEVVVALAITGLATGAIVSGYIFCTNSAQKAALALAANGKALERIEETRSAIWDTSVFPVVDQLVATNFPTRNVILDMSGTGVGVATAVIQTDISQISVNPPLKRIRVSCVWRYKNGPRITNVIETCRAPDQ